MAGYDKYHDELVIVPKGSMARGSGDITPMRGSRSSKADARREIADTNFPKGRRTTAREDYLAGRGTRAEQKERTESMAKGIAARLSTGESLDDIFGMKKGGQVKKMAKGGSVSSASKRADGCAVKGKTKGRMI